MLQGRHDAPVTFKHLYANSVKVKQITCFLVSCYGGRNGKNFENLKIYSRIHTDVRREKQHTVVLTFEDYTSQQDFGTRKVCCVSDVTFHAESKYAIKIFPSPTVFVQWPF